MVNKKNIKSNSTFDIVSSFQYHYYHNIFYKLLLLCSLCNIFIVLDFMLLFTLKYCNFKYVDYWSKPLTLIYPVYIHNKILCTISTTVNISKYYILNTICHYSHYINLLCFILQFVSILYIYFVKSHTAGGFSTYMCNFHGLVVRLVFINSSKLNLINFD